MLWTAHHTRSHTGSFPQDVLLGSTREWPPFSRLQRPVSQCPSLLHGADRSPLPWVGFSCPTPHLWGFAGLRGHLLPSDLISPTACFALAAGQPGSGLPLQLPLFTGPGRWTICSLILRKAVLQIWNCAHRQCTTDWKCLVHTGIWGHPRQAE